MPTRIREQLKALDKTEFTITRSLSENGCLAIYTREHYLKIAESMHKLPRHDLYLRRRHVGNAQDFTLDDSGRILISPELRSQAKLGTDLVLVGMDNFFELWSADALAKCEAEDDARLEADPSSLAPFEIYL